MPHIILNNVSLDYPVYDAESRSLRRSVTRVLPVGGKIRRRVGKRTYILALDKISVSLKDGDRVALLGHNGAGKTSFLKLLAGFYEPTSGTIEKEGKTSAMLNLMAGMDVSLSGYENILLCGTLHGLRRKEVLERMDEIADFSELGTYLHMPVRLYSSGMVQRLAFSISTSINCEILLLDEWFGAGDYSFRQKTSERLSKLVFNSAILVYATHSPEIARELCTKAIYLEHVNMCMFDEIDAVLEFSHQAQVRAGQRASE